MSSLFNEASNMYALKTKYLEKVSKMESQRTATFLAIPEEFYDAVKTVGEIPVVSFAEFIADDAEYNTRDVFVKFKSKVVIEMDCTFEYHLTRHYKYSDFLGDGIPEHMLFINCGLYVYLAANLWAVLRNNERPVFEKITDNDLVHDLKKIKCIME